jgi:hypothetical protein
VVEPPLALVHLLACHLQEQRAWLRPLLLLLLLLQLLVPLGHQ